MKLEICLLSDACLSFLDVLEFCHLEDVESSLESQGFN